MGAWKWLAGVFCCTIAASIAAEGPPRERREPARTDDSAEAGVQDFIFAGPLRPLWVRLHVQIDGQPFRRVWRNYVAELTSAADSDGDGRLTLAQANAVDLLLRPGAGAPEKPAADLAACAQTQGDSITISLEALAAFYVAAAPALTGRELPGNAAGRLAVFALLDADGNRHLSLDELASAASQLSRRDFNNDEVVTAEEIGAVASIAGTQPATAVATAPLSIDSPLIVVNAADGEKLADTLLARYDRNGDAQLSTADDAEVQLAAALAERLDASGDHQLDREELGRFLERTPDMELRMSLGRAGEEDLDETPPAADAPSAMAIRAKKRLDGSFQLDVGDARIELRRNNKNPARDPDAPVFSDFDADANAYIDATEAQGNVGLSAMFKVADADADGKLFRPEFQKHIERQGGAAASRLLFDVTDRGQELFTLLDANADGRLTLRELREAPGLIETEDKNGDARLGADEIPQQVFAELSRGDPSLAATARAAPRSRTRRTARRPSAAGPEWFQRMDRNGDGDLSEREFLGKPEVFERLDADRDGFIDAREAKAA